MLLAAGATTALGYPVRKWLTERGNLDVPNHRSSHQTPVPRGGGIAGLLGAATAATITNYRPRNGVVLSIAGLAALGWLDDVTGHVPARARLLGQLAAGSMCLSHGPTDAPVSAITAAGVVNVFNFMDGINGISGLTALVWGLNAVLLEDHGDGQLSTLGALTAGVGLGFLPHNLLSAKLFLGDIGSYALGAAMAAGTLSQGNLHARYQVASPLLLYGVDAAQALLSRAMTGKRLGEAHRDHVYQRLVDSGSTHERVALTHAVAAASVAAASRLGRWATPVSTAICIAYMALPSIVSNGQANNNEPQARATTRLPSGEPASRKEPKRRMSPTGQLNPSGGTRVRPHPDRFEAPPWHDHGGSL